VAGTITVAANGAFTFNPAPGYVGPAPAIAYVVKGSDGQTNPSELTIDVLPREGPSLQGGCRLGVGAKHRWGVECAISLAGCML
jgi:hypothetical protein